MYADELLEPWLAPLRDQVPELELFDCHTHVGVNDPSGFSVTPQQLIESLEIADSRAAVFPLKEPDGYRDANLRAVALADAHADRLVAFCRLDPADEPRERAEEALAAGGRGIKLHDGVLCLHCAGPDPQRQRSPLLAVQFGAPPRQERLLLALAAELEEARRWPERRPPTE